MPARDAKGSLERRGFATHMEMRDSGSGYSFSGYASVFDTDYEVGDFTERIARGAFARTLREKPDCVLVLNHGTGGSGFPLARTTSGTLHLEEDERGLHVSAELDPSDPDVQLLRPKMARGDVTEMSFAFRCTGEEWNSDRTVRTIRGATLHQGDVSIVTAGANPSTEAALRSRINRRTVETNHTLRAQQELDLIAAQGRRTREELRAGAFRLGLPSPSDPATRRQRAALEAVSDRPNTSIRRKPRCERRRHGSS